MKLKYRVKPVIDNHFGISKPEVKYVIQRKRLSIWVDCLDKTSDKERAYSICAKMNKPYLENKIILSFDDVKEAIWVVDCAMAAIEESYEKGSVRYDEMKTHHKELHKQIINQKKMSWNWQKINGIKNTPDFNKSVLLVEKKDNKFYGMVGFLTSIDGNGCHWKSTKQSGINDIFNFMLNNVENESNFNPTHWIEIELPKD